jgi:putative ABC transport system permease protein
MLLNYLKLSLRRMARNPFFTVINVTGLSIGFTAFYLLWPYSQNELKSDQFHKDYEQIARISRRIQFTENGIFQDFSLSIHNSGIARQFARDYPEIIDITCIVPQQLFEAYRQGFDKDVFVSVSVDGRNREFYREQNLAFADSNFFRFFSFPLERGNPEEVLSQPNTAVLSSSHAYKYFGKDNPVNKVIYFNDSIPITIKGVFKDFPKNTHMRGDVIISTAGIKQLNLTGWETTWWGLNYIKVAKGTDFNVLESKINADKKRIYSGCPRCPEDVTTSAFIEPLKTVVFTNLPANMQNYKSEYWLMVLSVLAFVLPALAWINYISLSIHMLQRRISELTVRKVVGSGRRHFVMQFVVEASLFNAVSLLIALTIVQLVKSPVENLLNFYTLPWNELRSSTLWIIAIALLLGIAITSAYPIFISINEKSLLAARKNWSYSKSSWINLIVTAQYSAAIVLLICIVCVYFQLNLILSKPLGIEKDGVLVIDCPLQQKNDFLTKLNYFATSAGTIEGIQGVTVSKNVVGDWAGYGVPLQVNKDEIEFGFDINGGVDENFLNVYGIKLLHGRNFRTDMPADQNAILVSREATVKLGFSLPEEALGARLILPWYGHDNVEVIGVYEDYEFRPLFTTYFQGKRGSFLSYRNYLMPDLYPSKISVRVDYTTFQSSLPELEKLFKEVFTHDTFRWTFLDQNVQKYYSTEKIARNQIGIFTLIAVGIACLGLFGLVSNKIVEKTKEIGIRKILGAGLPQIARILLNTTTWQIAVASIISIPIAYILVSQYLEKFSERISLQWWHFAFPLLTLILMMLATIATVVWKAARSNPVDALKHE